MVGHCIPLCHARRAKQVPRAHAIISAFVRPGKSTRVRSKHPTYTVTVEHHATDISLTPRKRQEYVKIQTKHKQILEISRKSKISNIIVFLILQLKKQWDGIWDG